MIDYIYIGTLYCDNSKHSTVYNCINISNLERTTFWFEAVLTKILNDLPFSPTSHLNYFAQNNDMFGEDNLSIS